jgi:hypothetical protein
MSKPIEVFGLMFWEYSASSKKIFFWSPKKEQLLDSFEVSFLSSEVLIIISTTKDSKTNENRKVEYRLLPM